MSSWIIPYIDQDLSFWHDIAQRFGPYIREVYFPFPDGLLPSGRPPQPERHLRTFLRHCRLPKAVLLNPIVLPQPMEETGPRILSALKSLHDESGIESVTVTSPALARRIQEELPEMRVAASTLMGVRTPVQALYLAGIVDGITVDGSLVRDIGSLRQLRASYAGEIRLIVNEGCLPGCLYRTQHFFEMSAGLAHPQSLCQPLLEQKPWLRLTGAWVLPRHLAIYDGLCDAFKLAGRVTLSDPQHYKRVLSAYLNRSDLLPMSIGGGPASVTEPIDLDDAHWDCMLHCNRDCARCTRCQVYYLEHLVVPGPREPSQVTG